MKLMISGSRTATTTADIEKLTGELNRLKPCEILHGGAVGADEIADKWAKQNGCKVTVIKPDYAKYGKAATHMRNNELLNLCEKVLCYYGTNDGTTTAGTASVATKAKKQNKLIAEMYRTDKAPTAQAAQITLF